MPPLRFRFILLISGPELCHCMGCRLSGGPEVAPHHWNKARENPVLCIPTHSSPSGRQREYRQPQALSSSLPQFPSFPPLQAGLFLLLHSLIPFLSSEHSLECKTIESNLPIAQIGKLRLRKIGTCSELYKLLAEPVKKVNSDCIGGVAGERLGAGPEWFPSLTAVTSQDNAGTKFSFWSSSCGDFYFYFFLLEK